MNSSRTNNMHPLATTLAMATTFAADDNNITDHNNNFNIDIDNNNNNSKQTSPSYRKPQAIGCSQNKETNQPAAAAKLQNKQKIYCSFCRNNGEEQSFYQSHKLKDENGKVVCPVLMNYKCPTCGVIGEHTKSYCPANRNKQQQQQHQQRFNGKAGGQCALHKGHQQAAAASVKAIPNTASNAAPARLIYPAKANELQRCGNRVARRRIGGGGGGNDLSNRQTVAKLNNPDLDSASLQLLLPSLQQQLPIQPPTQQQPLQHQPTPIQLQLLHLQRQLPQGVYEHLLSGFIDHVNQVLLKSGQRQLI